MTQCQVSNCENDIRYIVTFIGHQNKSNSYCDSHGWVYKKIPRIWIKYGLKDILGAKTVYDTWYKKSITPVPL